MAGRYTPRLVRRPLPLAWIILGSVKADLPHFHPLSQLLFDRVRNAASELPLPWELSFNLRIDGLWNGGRRNDIPFAHEEEYDGRC